jgi:hypothetical protein
MSDPSGDRLEPTAAAPDAPSSDVGRRETRFGLPGPVGLGWRTALAADLLADPGRVDFVEIVAETCFVQGATRLEALSLRELWPVIPHGVKLSLGSAEGIDLERARRLGALARELRAPVITEHLAFTRAGGRDIGHLTPLPYTREAVGVVARNVAAARRVLPGVPLLLENIAWTFRWPDDDLDEGDFYGEVVRATGCDLLLDLGNLFANALNAGIDPGVLLRRYPLDRVAMVHLAGGVYEHGFYLDTHAHAVPETVFGLLEVLLRHTGRVPVILERDALFPAFAETAGELARVAELERRAGGRSGGETSPHDASDVVPAAAEHGVRAAAISLAPAASAAVLETMQARLADQLTRLDAPDATAVAPFDPAAIARTRAVLRHKRIDDALPLLPRLTQHGEAFETLARACVERLPRAPARAGVVDAIRFAEAAIDDDRLADAARHDLLLLRARFIGPGPHQRVSARIGPFVGRERLPGGGTLWAIKGLGPNAPIRVFQRKEPRP